MTETIERDLYSRVVGESREIEGMIAAIVNPKDKWKPRPNTYGLLPCPFCGCDYTELDIFGPDELGLPEDFGVICHCGGCMYCACESKQEAADAWNERLRPGHCKESMFQ